MAQVVVPWNTGITANWYRANQLVSFAFPPLSFQVVEENTEQNWKLTFKVWQSFRVTTEECAWRSMLSMLPDSGGFFEILESEWLLELGRNDLHFLKTSRHFVVCSYDEIIEVAAWDCAIEKLNQNGYPEGQGRIQIDPSEVYQGTAPDGDNPLSKMLRMKLASRNGDQSEND